MPTTQNYWSRPGGVYSNPCGLSVFGCAVYVAVKPLGHIFSGDLPFLPLPPFIADIAAKEATSKVLE
jgi:hypothetical protein